MNKWALLACVGLLLFTVACGSGSSNNPPFTPTGNFSNASLNGQYTYQLNGIDLGANAAYVRAGVFTANGNGTISAGNDDFSEDSPIGPSAFTGTYSIANDGTGSATLTFSTGTLTLALTLVSSGKVYMVEADTTLTGAGVALQQTASAFANPPGGTFVFRDHNINSSLGPIGSVGVMTVAGGFTVGSEDVSVAGVGTTRAITGGTFNFPDATNGRGTGTFTDDSGVTNTFNYYVVNTTQFNIFCTTPNAFGLGTAELQTGGPFTNGSLSGSYAYGSTGDTLTYINGVHTVGRFTSDGGGNLSAGAFDVAQDGVPASNVAYTGTYTIDATGRAALAITPTSGGSGSQIYYMVNPKRAFFLVLDPSKVAEGSADLQTVTSFTNSSINGQFGFLNHGFTINPADTYDRVGTLIWNGSGGLTLNEFVNVSGTGNGALVTGNYSVATNGRGTGTLTNLSNNLVFYFVSGTSAYELQNDTGVEIDGITSQQID